MAEAAATVEEAGVEPLMSLAASERQLRAARHAGALAEADLAAADLAAVIDHIRRPQAAPPGNPL
jgi:hypothetical protein